MRQAKPSLRLSPSEFALALHAGLIDYTMVPGDGTRVGGQYVGRSPTPRLGGAPVAIAA